MTLLSTPLYSNTTLVCFFPTLAGGGTVVLMKKFDAGKYLELAQAHRMTHTMLVPVQYRRLMDRPDFGDFDLSSTHLKFCTSAPFSAELKGEVLTRWPGGLVEYFGMTEGGGTCILIAHEHPDKLHTVGQPAPGHDIRLIDEDGVQVGAGVVGEIVGRSGGMMNGYHGQPGKTAEATWVSPEGWSFIRTGDVGRFDEEGFLTLMDRKKDMIISGGFNIYPSDIEAEIVQHPEVVEAAVVGVPSTPGANRRWLSWRLSLMRELTRRACGHGSTPALARPSGWSTCDWSNPAPQSYWQGVEARTSGRLDGFCLGRRFRPHFCRDGAPHLGAPSQSIRLLNHKGAVV